MAIEFKLPDLGEGIHEAEILAVNVKEGDTVKEDQEIFEVETDKAVVAIPCPVAGVVTKINVKVGDVAHVGDVLITFDASSSGAAALPAARAEREPASTGHRESGSSSAASARSEAAVGHREAGAGGGAAGASAGAGGRGKSDNGRASAVADAPVARTGAGPVPAAPATRRMARDLGVDLKQVQGSGPAGRVTKEDIRAFTEGVPSARTSGPAVASGAPASSRQAAPSVAEKYGGGKGEAAPGGPLTLSPVELPDFSKYGPVERVPLRSLRKKIALNMAQAWSHVPHVSNFDEADITDVERYRAQNEKAVAERGGKLTLTVLAIKAVVSGLKKYPQFNCSLDENTSEIVFKNYFNIGVAVATERGLIVPVIRDADKKNMVEISIELADIAKKTREGKIELDKLQGGTFTITNIGPIGGTGMTPMVNYPEVAIIGMARSSDKPVVRNGQIVVRNILPLALSFDHRVADGAKAAMFLRHIASCLEDPFKLLLEV